MKVLVVTPSYPRFKGDYYGRFVHDLCCKLAKNGIDLKVLAPRSKSSEAFQTIFEVRRFPYLPFQAYELLPERTMKGAPLRHLVQLPTYLLSAFFHLSAESTNIVHIHLAIPLGFVSTFNPRRTPLIVTCHGSDCTLPYKDPVYRPFVKHTLKKADRVVAVSNFIRRLTIGLGAPPDKVETIYLGVDTAKFQPPEDRAIVKEKFGVPAHRLVIGTLGRLVPDKRVEDFIRAAAIVSKELDVRFLIGGEGPQRKHLEALASRLSLENVSFLGEVRDSMWFHRLCDIFVLASVREGLSMSLQEAMATGCVPVAVNGYGCPELVSEDDNGFLFPPGDVEGLSEKIMRAASNLDLGKRARETVEERFDSEKNAERYVELYHDLISNR
ncbi:MAG: glycosyltransferase family 4 protein [Candidatus Bathyarchaeia archaeon]